jgi:hypothetical protein
MEIRKSSTPIRSTQTNNTETVSSQKSGTQDTGGIASAKDKFEKSVAGATQAKAITHNPVSPQEEKVVRAFYEKAWNKGDLSVMNSHPQIAQECHRQLAKYKDMFPDLQINVNSMEKRNEEVWINWTAQGSRIDKDSGKNIPQTVDGLTRMTIADGEITSAKATWNDRSLQQNLNKIIG